MTADQERRTRAENDVARSFVVEASAGTGKTSTLIRRILGLVLDAGPDGAPLPLTSICAITFTEKAAGEMKIRLREALERETIEEGPRGQRAVQALRELDFAAISTIHSFAVSLLKERPIEAGLDPRFTALDEAGRRILFDETWDRWIQLQLERRPTSLENTLRGGLRLDHLRDLANELALRSRLIGSLSPLRPPSEEETAAIRSRLAERLAGLLETATDPLDRLCGALADALEWLANPPGGTWPRRAGNIGSAKNWGGKEAIAVVRDAVREAVEMAEDWPKLPRRRLLYDLLTWLRESFLPEWSRRKVEGGFVDFDDQLYLARDLLRTGGAALREFRSRFRTLLVDEFQDTDGVQLEIVLRLAAANPAEPDPSKLKPAAGRLFIVGDPKQSIYRFRGADIESYMQVADRGGAATAGVEKLELTTNFRSVPGILRFVDTVFTRAMTRTGGYQPDYLPFGGDGYRQPEADASSVHLLAELGPAGQFAGSGTRWAESEARDIARLIGGMRQGDAWMVTDPDGSRRLPRWGDIAVLVPVMTKSDLIERELQDLGIPYVLEGGRFYYTRNEVSSALTVLASIANPNDTVSLYGALRSIFFGLSDEDLLRAKLDGLPLDYRQEVPGHSPLSRPFKVLRRLHALREQCPASETLERLMIETGAREVLAAHGFQSIANLAKLVRKLRSVQAGRTFHQSIRCVRAFEEDETAESESRLMEERGDAVRILSVHRSKGLDFRIAIVASLGTGRRSRGGAFVADAHVSRAFAIRIPSAEGWVSEGWEALCEAEKEREDAELVRLLYVALTRARDHLIVSVRARVAYNKKGDKVFPRTRLEPIGLSLEAVLKDLPQGVSVIQAGVPAPDVPRAAPQRASPEGLATRLAREKEELTRTVAAGSASCEKSRPSWEFSMAEESSGNRAVRLGSAFHEVMETADVFTGAVPEVFLAEVAGRRGLNAGARAELVSMLRAALDSDLLARARKARQSGGRVLRELPFLRPEAGTAGGVEEGRIDLAFEEDGEWVLVEYKTDRLAEDPPGAEAEKELLGRHGAQVAGYAAALRDAGVPCREAWLLAARTGLAVRVL